MRRDSWQFRTAAVLLPLSAALYLGSLFMDIFVIERELRILGVGRTETEAYRLFGAIHELWNEGELGLAVIITAFSFLFPVGKYLALAFVALSRDRGRRNRVLDGVKNLGQWSMGDVFVVALMVVIVRVDNGIAEVGVSALAGLWVFAAGVVSSMVVSALFGFTPEDDRRRD